LVAHFVPTFFYVAPLRFGFCLACSTLLREGLRQQGVVLLRWTA
jgi:hypothetical protein